MSEAAAVDAEEQVDTPEVTEEPNYLDMSDEDFEKLADEEIVETPVTAAEPEEAEPAAEEPVKEIVTEEAGVNPETSGSDAEELPAETEQAKEADHKVDYKAEYERLIAPFKANKSVMQVANTDEAIRLMQMGANYAKKMHDIKPHLRFIETLKDNDLLDEDRLNFLIDLDKKNPDAIRKLVGTEGIEALGYDQELPEYKPKPYTVNSQDAEVRQALDEIKDSPVFERTVEVIGNKLDDSSKQLLGQKPNLIPTINEHIQLGVYDHIMGIVEQRRLLGEFDGVPDLEAYRVVGDFIDSQGGFDQLKAQTQQQGQYAMPGMQGAVTPTAAPATANETPLIPPKPQATPQEIVDRKRAASPTRSGRTPQQAEPNYLAMSDEEFEKRYSSL